MHPLRLAAALPAGALALTLAASPAAAWPGYGHDGHGGHGSHDWHHGGPHGHGPAPQRGGEAREPGTISVTGQGESTAAPDMAVVTLGVTVQAPSAAEAMRQNTQAQQVVIDTLRARGIEGRDIQTSGLNLTPVQDYSREGQPPVVTGYQATNLVTVRVRDLPRLGEALDALVAAGANEIHGIGFQREDLDDAEGNARARAVENARLRAEIMANAAGMELGRLVAISDVAARQGPQPMMRAMAQSAADSAAVPVEAGELSIMADVNVTWELRPARRGDGPGRRHRGGMGDHGTSHHGMMPGGMEGMPMHHESMHQGMGGGSEGGMAAAPGNAGTPAPEGAGVGADAAAAAAGQPTDSGAPGSPVVAPPPADAAPPATAPSGAP